MRTLIDTGPLVAYVNRRDAHHRWVLGQTAWLTPPLYTCEAVFTEAHHLVAGVPNGKERLLSFVKRDLVVVDFSYADKSERVEQLMTTYADLPMDFADACLVCMIEENSDSRVFTLDGDFYVYRTADGGALNVLHPRGYLIAL